MFLFKFNQEDIIQALQISAMGFISLFIIILLITIFVYCVNFIIKKIDAKK